jgi:hypothetical protein
LSDRDIDILINEDLGDGINGLDLLKVIFLTPIEDNLVGKSEFCTPANPRKYTDSNDGLCKNCDPRCFRCTGPTHGDCIECMPGWYEEGGYCLDCSDVATGINNGPRCVDEAEFKLLNRRLNSEALNLTLLLTPLMSDFITMHTGDLDTTSEQWKELEAFVMFRIWKDFDLSIIDEYGNENNWLSF